MMPLPVPSNLPAEALPPTCDTSTARKSQVAFWLSWWHSANASSRAGETQAARRAGERGMLVAETQATSLAAALLPGCAAAAVVAVGAGKGAASGAEAGSALVYVSCSCSEAAGSLEPIGFAPVEGLTASLCSDTTVSLLTVGASVCEFAQAGAGVSVGAAGLFSGLGGWERTFRAWKARVQSNSSSVAALDAMAANIAMHSLPSRLREAFRQPK